MELKDLKITEIKEDIKKCLETKENRNTTFQSLWNEAKVLRAKFIVTQAFLKKQEKSGSSHHGSAETNLTSILEDADLIPGLAQWVKDPVLP